MIYIEGIEFKKLKIPFSGKESANLITPISAAEVIADSKYKIVRDSYNCTLMLYTIKGEGKLHYLGNEYTLKENDLMIIDCRKPHIYFSPTGYWEHAYFDFTGLNSLFLTEKLNQSAVRLQLTPIEKEHFFKIIDLFFLGNSHFELMFHKECTDLFAELISREGKTKSDISTAIDYIKLNFKEDISIKHLASLSHMSEVTFTRKFKAAMHTTPHDYIIKMKVQEAAQLLLSTTLSLEEIAENTGFYDRNHLIRHFKKQTGTTPSKYRRVGNSALNQT